LATQPKQKTVAPYGAWSSPISAEMVASAGASLSAPWLTGGTAWWLEGRPHEQGRVVLMKAGPGEDPTDAVPPGFNVRSRAHEYGGGAYCIHGETAFFSNFDDQRLYRLEPGSEPVAITPSVEEQRQRYADGRVTADGSLWLGVRERHEGSGRPQEVVNELVAIPTDGSAEPRTIAGGRDFYAAPRISPDGTQLSFLAWDLPWLPWDGCELYVAPLASDGRLGEATHIAGRDGGESIWQPDWSPAGDLVFASDRSGWWNLEAVRDGRRRVLHQAEAEFGYPAWTFGGQSWAFVEDGRIVCAYDRGGRTFFGVLDPESGELADLDLEYEAFRALSCLAAERSTVLLIAGAATIPQELARLDLETGVVDVVRKSSEVPVDASYLSMPRAIEFPTEGELSAYGVFYPPTNPDFAAPEGERPPLVVMVHGGPTDKSTTLFDLEMHFWTSRGFAVVDVNYGGSTGYGRRYRQRLNRQWGVVDLHDCVNAARYLVERGEADGERLLVTGGSAGGYTTICALTFTDDFAAGTSYFGLADLEQFAAGETHKFELQYEHTLVGPYPEAAALYRERSPIHFTDRMTTPMLVLQGSDDKVVPPLHAELIVNALRERDVPHAYILFEGEGHGFRKAENIARALEAELSFYAQILGIEPGNPIPRLPIEDLPREAEMRPETR
jgi:dipeptidyl aminopeptidase/acylaminoacyl peptidase